MSEAALGSVGFDLPQVVAGRPKDVVRRPRTAARSGRSFVELLTESGCGAQRRRRITDEAYPFVTREHRNERSIAPILEAVADAVERRP